MKQLLTPASLAMVVFFFPLRALNQTLHLVHRALFRGLLFYLPPTASDVAALLPAPLHPNRLQALSSKERKRLIKKAQASASGAGGPGGAAHVELQLTAIDQPMYGHMASRRFHQLETFVAVHVVLLGLVTFEQMWIAYRTEHDVVQLDGSVLPMVRHAGVTTSTVLALIVGLLYDIWLGLSSLSAAQHASTLGGADGTVDGVAVSADSRRYWYRIVGVLGGFVFFGTLLAQSLGHLSTRAGWTTSFLGAADGAANYAAYVDQVAFNLITAAHRLVEDGIASANVSSQSSIDGVRALLPTRPASVGDVHLSAVFPLIALKLVLSLVCAIVSASFLCSAWRFSKLFTDKLADLADQWRGDEEAISSTTTVTAAPPSIGARVKLAGEWGLLVWNFLSPLFVALMFLPAFSLEPIIAAFMSTASSSSSSSAAASIGVPPSSSSSPADPHLLHHNAQRAFELFRVGFLLVCLVLRLSSLRTLLQSFFFSSLSVIRSLPSGGGTGGALDQYTGVRIQTVLKSVFWYAPTVALQQMYPCALAALLVAALKLADEYTPDGLTQDANSSSSTSSTAAAGWGVGYLIWRTGVSPFLSAHPTSLLAQAINTLEAHATTAAGAAPSDSASSLPPLDADEFDGDIMHELEEHEASMAPGVSASASATASTASGVHHASSFHRGGRNNILASSLAFLLFFVHLIWFLETALCVAWIRLRAREKAPTRAAAVPGGLTTRPAAASEGPTPAVKKTQ